MNKKAEDANQKIGEKELLGREILPRFSFSFNDLTQIWKLQVVMEERKPTQILKIAFARSFRAAHDLFVLRGELGQVSPELVDWWTKFRETEDGPEREQMISSLPDAAKSKKKKRSYKRKSSKVKSGAQNKSEVSARTTQSISDNTQLAEPSKNVSVPGTVEAAPKPSAELKTTPAEEDNKAKVRNSAKSKEATTKAKNDSEASPVIVQKKTRRRKKTTTVAQSNQTREQPAETEQTGRKKTPQKSVLLSNKS